ncbi:MAG: D-alanyl-D-alanine carboxypeptidase/D-alanyl-D-alanine endopeptidase [Longimicrobiales bacterium]
MKRILTGHCMKHFLTLTFGLGVLSGCAPAMARSGATPAVKPLAAVVDSVVSTAPLIRTHWGILVVDGANGRELFRHDAQRHYIPASNTKLVVTAVALGTLGSDYRYSTEMRAAGGAGDSVDVLVVSGSGDPTLSARFHGERYAALDSMAQRIAQRGLRHIDSLIVDASAFDDTHVHSAWEVGDLPWSYAPPTGAFAVEEGTFTLIVEPGATLGAPARVWVDGTAAQPIAGTIITDTAGARPRLSIDYLARTDTVFLSGSIGLGMPADTSMLAVTRPDRFAARALAEALARVGVVVGDVDVVHDSATAYAYRSRGSLLMSFESPDMSDIVAAILQPSQNWIAEQLLKTLGAVYRDDGSWSAGLDVEREYLVGTAGVDSMAFSLRDASGLSAQNLLAPEAIVQLLAHARAQPWASAYRTALARPGLEDSTLENRLEALAGRLFAKTGTISNVATLSGYLVTDDGRDVLFSIMANSSGRSSGDVRAGIDRIVSAIATEDGS